MGKKKLKCQIVKRKEKNEGKKKSKKKEEQIERKDYGLLNGGKNSNSKLIFKIGK